MKRAKYDDVSHNIFLSLVSLRRDIDFRNASDYEKNNVICCVDFLRFDPYNYKLFPDKIKANEGIINELMVYIRMDNQRHELAKEIPKDSLKYISYNSFYSIFENDVTFFDNFPKDFIFLFTKEERNKIYTSLVNYDDDYFKIIPKDEVTSEIVEAYVHDTDQLEKLSLKFCHLINEKYLIELIENYFDEEINYYSNKKKKSLEEENNKKEESLEEDKTLEEEESLKEEEESLKEENNKNDEEYFEYDEDEDVIECFNDVLKTYNNQDTISKIKNIIQTKIDILKKL
jgi:hypothetical protein